MPLTPEETSGELTSVTRTDTVQADAEMKDAVDGDLTVYRQPPSYKIAALDFETLDLNPVTTIVFDAALSICTADCQNPDEVVSHGWRLNIFEQIAMGRTLTPETSLWHVKLSDREHFTQHLEGTANTARPYKPTSLQDFFDEMEVLCEDVQELWINGLSFDPIIVRTLGDAIGRKVPWFFRKEVDVRTMHKRVPYQEQGIIAKLEKKAAHDAIADTLWNLNQALSYHQWVTQIPPFLMFAKTTKV